MLSQNVGLGIMSLVMFYRFLFPGRRRGWNHPETSWFLFLLFFSFDPRISCFLVKLFVMCIFVATQRKNFITASREDLIIKRKGIDFKSWPSAMINILATLNLHRNWTDIKYIGKKIVEILGTLQILGEAHLTIVCAKALFWKP